MVLGVVLAAMILFLLFMTLMTGRENVWAGLGLGVATAMFCLAFAAFVRRLTVNFDRACGTVVIRTVSIFGQKQQSLALSDVERAVVETQVSRSTGSSGGRHQRTMHETHRPSLRMAQGIVPLHEHRIGGKSAAEAVAAINAWLDAGPQA